MSEDCDIPIQTFLSVLRGLDNIKEARQEISGALNTCEEAVSKWNNKGFPSPSDFELTFKVLVDYGQHINRYLRMLGHVPDKEYIHRFYNARVDSMYKKATDDCRHIDYLLYMLNGSKMKSLDRMFLPDKMSFDSSTGAVSFGTLDSCMQMTYRDYVSRFKDLKQRFKGLKRNDAKDIISWQCAYDNLLLQFYPDMMRVGCIKKNPLALKFFGDACSEARRICGLIDRLWSNASKMKLYYDELSMMKKRNETLIEMLERHPLYNKVREHVIQYRNKLEESKGPVEPSYII